MCILLRQACRQLLGCRWGGEGVHGAGGLTTARASGRHAMMDILGSAQPVQLKLNFLTEIHAYCFPSY